MSDSNAILAKRVLENDQSAFAILFGRHHARVFRVCLKMLGHRQDAEDMTQETFSRAAKYLERWDSRRPFEPWLVAIAGNRCRSFLSSRRGHRTLSPLIEPAVEGDPSGAFAALNEEVDFALDQLNETQRKAFELFHRDGLGYQDIADQMDRPIGTIKTWIHRARIQLIQRLQDREVVHIPSVHHSLGDSTSEVSS